MNSLNDFSMTVGHSLAPAMAYTLFVPMGMDTGKAIAALEWAEHQILTFAGGLTRFGYATGFWISPSSSVVRDTIVPVQSIMPPSEEADRRFSHLAKELAILLGEEEIFLLAQPLYLVDTMQPK